MLQLLLTRIKALDQKVGASSGVTSVAPSPPKAPSLNPVVSALEVLPVLDAGLVDGQKPISEISRPSGATDSEMTSGRYSPSDLDA